VIGDFVENGNVAKNELKRAVRSDLPPPQLETDIATEKHRDATREMYACVNVVDGMVRATVFRDNAQRR
jgi:hypothetical protein